MTIPIGKDYTFTLKVLQPNSLEPLDVTGYAGTFTAYRQDDYTNKPVSDAVLTPVVGSEALGLVTCTILGTETSGITIAEGDKGDPADNTYVKSRYAGFIHLSKVGSANVNVLVPKISFVFAG